MAFKVIAVWDGNTIEVEPEWEYDGKRGSKLEAAGYEAPSKGSVAMNVEQRLSALLLNRVVELQSPVEIRRNRLVAAVYFNGINLSEYFSEYKLQAQAEIPSGEVVLEDTPPPSADDTAESEPGEPQD